MTFVQDGRPDPNSEEEILTFLITGAENAFGREFSPDERSVVRSFYDPAAEYFADQQEDIAEVLNSAQLDYAEGEALDLLTALIGISRQEAQPATTRLQFRHDTPVTRDYTIPPATGAQTDSTDSVRFLTDEISFLRYIDGFENGLSAYSGDTGDFSTSTAEVYEDDNSLTSSADATIVDVNTIINIGSRFHSRIYLTSGTSAGFLFGVDTLDDKYKAVVDSNNDEIVLEVTEDGSTSDVGSASVTIPNDEWLHLQVDWEHDGDFVLTVFDSSDNEVGTLEASEAEATFETGSIGFSSENSNGSVYFDEASMSRVSVDATATETGTETNVGQDVVTILSTSIPGVDTVTNPIVGQNGSEEESDEDFRERTKQTLGDSVASTLPSLISSIRSMEQTRSVTVIDNDTNSTDGAGRPGHSFEAIVDVDSEYYTDVADTIVDTKAVGDASVGGYSGTSVSRMVELVNGQEKEITFSVPTQVTIYVDVSLDKTENYADDEQVRDNIVQYTGGELSSGSTTSGEINAGDDVIYYQIIEAIMDVEGVRDVTDLQIATTDPPTGESNITIDDSETANTIADSATIDVSSSDI